MFRVSAACVTTREQMICHRVAFSVGVYLTQFYVPEFFHGKARHLSDSAVSDSGAEGGLSSPVFLVLSPDKEGDYAEAKSQPQNRNDSLSGH